MLSALDRQHSVAPPGFSRWLIPPAALSVHLCIGQVYATSVYKNSFVDHFDASATSVGIIFSYRSRRSTSLVTRQCRRARATRHTSGMAAVR
jgi:hypothetical protein